MATTGGVWVRVGARTRRKPPPADPTDWVYTWLKEHGLEESAKRLLDANFLTRDDLLLEPRLDCTDLEKLGVIKAADRRKIFNLVKELR